MKQINLLPKKAKLEFAKIQRAEKVNFFLILGAVFFFLFLSFVFGVDLFLKKENAKLTSEIQMVKKEIERKRETELQLFLLKERIASIEKIFKERKNFGQTLWEVATVLPAEATIEMAKADGGGIEIVFWLPNFNLAGEFIDNFPYQKLEKFTGKSIKVPSITRKDEGKYLVDLRIAF